MFNHIITWYHNGTKRIIDKCFYHEGRSYTMGKAEIGMHDTFKVIIPTLEDVPFEAGDIIVKGECDFEFDTASEATLSASLKELKSAHHIYTIQNITRNLFGGNSNIELSCK